MPSTRVIIIDPDRLRSIGLRHMLNTFFDLEADVFTDLPARFTEEDHQTLYVVTAELFAEWLDFFMPRRQRTAIIGKRRQGSTITVVDPTDDESQLVDCLSCFVDQGDAKAAHPETPLSQREVEVLRLVALGLINKEIAERLSISFNTVLTHRRNITSKLGIKSVSGLGVFALMNGYISENDLKR